MITIPYIEGDGIGPEVVSATRKVIDNVVSDIRWIKIPYNDYGMIDAYGVALKGPLETPVGSGHRSYNVQLRQTLDLYACIRPVKWYGLESPVKHPENVDIVIFRENTEDLYAGFEFDCYDAHTIDICKENGIKNPCTTAIGLKIISEQGSKRLMKLACKYALEHGRKKITIVHKGNIMKYTEGGFRRWCYDVAKDYPQIEVDDCICDAFFQNSLLHPENYDIVVTTNLNGDYISDALAAQVGGIGISPGVNMNDKVAVFEATHGTAPDIAGRGIANPCSCILSGAMMLDHLGYKEEADRIRLAVKLVCFRQIREIDDKGRVILADLPKTTVEWTDRIIENL